MRKKSFLPKMPSRTLLIALVSFLFASSSVAQESGADKIATAKSLFSPKLSSMNDEYRNKVVGFFENCSTPQKEAILSYMVQAITDSLKADKKEFAVNYIDYYRLIAAPDNEYLGSLVVTEGKYYYEKMDASKLTSLHSYLSDIAPKSTLDYSSEISELYRMRDEVLNGCQNLEGYWVSDFSKKKKADPFFICISKDYIDDYHVITEFSSVVEGGAALQDDYDFYMDISRYGNHKFWTTANPFLFRGTSISFECLRTRPNSLSFICSSEKFNVGKENLATMLRSGVRSVSNSVIGEMARSNTHSFGDRILGSTGAIIGEVLLNSLIDGLSISKKRIWTITGELTPIDKNNMDATLYVDVFTFRSNSNELGKEHLKIDVRMVRCQWDAPFISNSIAFADEKGLRQASHLSKKEKESFYKSHHEARKAVRAKKLYPQSSRALRKYNRLQLEKLKEYNKTH